jgi:hypothetical protein
MTLANMRANGVQTLAAWCLGRGCNHHRVLDVSAYPDDQPVPSFGPRLRCESLRALRCRRAAELAGMHGTEFVRATAVVRASAEPIGPGR